MKKWAAALCVVALAISGCSGDAKPSDDPNQPNFLRVLGSSELKDLHEGGSNSVFAKLAKDTGVKIELTETGTLDGAAQVASGQAGNKYGATWFSSNRYLSLISDAKSKVATATKVMVSPVIMGVRPDVAAALQWSSDAPPTWNQVREAVQQGKLTYAMTNPASSNSGFSSLVSVATALAGGGAAIDEPRIQSVEPQLREFFAGQKLTAGSTGWITDRFLAEPSIGALFSYESTLIQLNRSGRVPQPLVLITPKDGVVTADYPLTLLTSATDAQRKSYDKALAWLTSEKGQRAILDTTSRRPVSGGVKPDDRFGKTQLIELPFPATQQAADQLVSSYLNKVRRPTVTAYVLDVSGSMTGKRIDGLKKAVSSLANPQGTAFVSFHQRETVIIVPFSDDVKPQTTFTIPQDQPESELAKIRTTVNGLQAGGGTAIYEALKTGYARVTDEVQKNPGSYGSVVLMTDGASNRGINANAFRETFEATPAWADFPTFSVLFGEAQASDLDGIAKLTHGKVFDGNASDLTDVFKAIRAYQ